jgi:hypothetical protein
LRNSAGPSRSGSTLTKTIRKGSLPVPSWRRSLTNRASVVGQTSGQWVKPKKIA